MVLVINCGSSFAKFDAIVADNKHIFAEDVAERLFSGTPVLKSTFSVYTIALTAIQAAQAKVSSQTPSLGAAAVTKFTICMDKRRILHRK